MDAVTKEAEAAEDVLPGNVVPSYAQSANFESRLLSDVVRSSGACGCCTHAAPLRYRAAAPSPRSGSCRGTTGVCRRCSCVNGCTAFVWCQVGIGGNPGGYLVARPPWCVPVEASRGPEPTHAGHGHKGAAAAAAAAADKEFEVCACVIVCHAD